jgi:hypothetical protein
MSTFFGIILGILLTVGAAYISDALRKPGVAGAAEPPIVNWDVLGRKLKALSRTLQNGLAKLTGPRKDA